MKLSISVPDDLWTAVHLDDSAGPSDTVQRALKVLADQQAVARRPLANAPDQSDLARYQPAFEAAVSAAASAIRDALDNGYRLGLALAPGFTMADLDALDDPVAAKSIQRAVSSWGEPSFDDELFSYDFLESVGVVLDSMNNDDNPEMRALGDQILGAADDPAAGVVWETGEDGGGLPRINETYAAGVLAALKDVRDEARRRMTANDTTEPSDR